MVLGLNGLSIPTLVPLRFKSLIKDSESIPTKGAKSDALQYKIFWIWSMVKVNLNFSSRIYSINSLGSSVSLTSIVSGDLSPEEQSS